MRLIDVFMKHLGTKQIEALLKPPPKQPEPLDPAKENARALQMKLLTAFEFQDHDAHLLLTWHLCNQEWFKLIHQVYALLQSHISDHIFLSKQKQKLEQG